MKNELNVPLIITMNINKKKDKKKTREKKVNKS